MTRISNASQTEVSGPCRSRPRGDLLHSARREFDRISWSECPSGRARATDAIRPIIANVVGFVRVKGIQHDIACLRASKRVSFDFRRRPFAALLHVIDFDCEMVCGCEPDNLQRGRYDAATGECTERLP